MSTTTTPRAITVVSNAERGEHAAHKPGCRDIAREAKRSGAVVREFANYQEAMLYWFEDIASEQMDAETFAEALEWSGNIEYKPCAHDIPRDLDQNLPW